MSTIICRGCSKEIHDSAPTCPACGLPQCIPSINGATSQGVSLKQGTMKFQESITTCLSKILRFDGTASRSEFWWFILFIFGLIFFIGLLEGIADIYLGDTLHKFISGALLFSWIAVGARRLHDTNRSGWFLLIGLIPFVGWLVLIFFLAQKSVEPTRYQQ
jgi:uncharacterized membrane protein YhaH (DUF805 family)